MDNIEKAHSRGLDNYSTTNQKSMDKVMRSMDELTKNYRVLNKDLTSIQNKMRELSDNTVIPKDATRGQKREIEGLKSSYDKQFRSAQRQQQALNREYRQSLKYMQEMSQFKQSYSKNFTPAISSNQFHNLPKDRQRAENVTRNILGNKDSPTAIIDDLREQIKQVQNLRKRSDHVSRNASQAGYMSYQQGQSFRSDYNTSQGSMQIQMAENMKRFTDLGQQRSSIQEKIEEIENKQLRTPEDLDRKIGYDATLKSIDEEMEKRIELNRALDRTISDMRMFNERLEGVTQRHSRDTARGMMYERAPAIGLATMGAAGLFAGGLYSRGSSAKQGFRDDVVSIGQRTEQDDWRTNVRDNAMDAGLDEYRGFTTQEMLSFQNSYLSNRGFQDLDDLNTAMTSQADFSRVTGLSGEDTSEIFSNLFDNAKLEGSEVGDIQNAFVGAIKQSGMEGREKEQIDSLNELIKEVSEGTVVGKEETMNLMGLQSVLNSSDSEAIRGSSGMEAMQSLNQGIRGAIDDPQARLLFGAGSEFQGISSYYKVAQRMEKGVSDPENLQRLYNMAVSQVGEGGSELDQDSTFMALARERLNADVNTEQASALMDLVRRGELSQEGIDKVLATDTETGTTRSEEAMSRYQDSKEAVESQSEAVTEKQSIQFNDFGDLLRKANAALDSTPPSLYALGGAALSAAAALAGTAGSFAGSTLLRKGVNGSKGGRGGTGGGTGGAGGWLSTQLGKATGDESRRKGGLPNTGPISTGGKGGKLGKLSGLAGGAMNKVKGWFSGGTGGNQGIVASAPGGGGMFGKIGGLAGKAALPLALATGAIGVMSAPEEQKGEAIGGSVGGIGGSLGGATLGASIGSVVPGVGTAIGGIAGSFLGSSLGQKAGSWIGGLFGGGGKKENTVSAEETQTGMETQLERENTTRRNESQNKKADNLAQESILITKYNQVLDRAKEILAEARMQNGIFGKDSGVGGGMATGEGELNDLTGDLTKKDLADTGTMTPEDIDKWINSKAPKGSLMRGMGGAFHEAAQASGLDPRYLVSHAAHETGWGTSNILKKKNNWFGIGAFDNSPMSSAYSYGGRENGIVEGAKWIAENYYNKGNTTLDKMHDAGYATDPKWDSKIANIMKGSPKGSVNITSNVNVKVEGGKNLANQLKDNKELERAGKAVEEKLYGNGSILNFYSLETKRG